MLVNPSIYNNLGRFTSNYDLLSLQRRSGSSTPYATKAGYPYKNSLTDQINRQAYQQVSSFDTNFRTEVKNINAFAKMMSNTKSTIYNARTAVETSKSFDVSAKDGATLGQQSLKVTQLASAQKNTSAARAQNEVLTNDFEGTLNLKQNGKTQTFNLSLKAGETAGDGYLRIAKTINQGQTGVKAEVKTDENGYASLSLTSAQTGKASSFEVTGTMADALKLNDKQEDAKNLNYEANGVKGESETNQLSLDKGKITVDVKAVNTEAESFKIETSSRGLVNTLKDFAGAFNKFVDDNKDNTNPAAQAIMKQMSNTIQKSLDKMDIAGLSTNSDGKIVIDESKLAKGLEGNVEKVKETLTKFDSFASNITRKTDQVLSTPLANIAPDFTNNRLPIKPYLFNYNAQSFLDNISQLTNPGYIMDVRI